MACTVERVGDTEIHKTATGEVRVRLLDKDLVSIAVRGQFSSELLAPYLAAYERVVANSDRARVFVDAEDTTGYESEVRIEATEHMRRIRPRLLSVQLLVRSKIVAMGVSVANLALGGFMTVHTRRAAFDAALAAAAASGKGSAARG
jgi:hypothetical protein